MAGQPRSGRFRTPTTFTYDVLDNLTSISQGTHLKTLTYSPTTDQLTALIDSATGTTVFTYDAQGNLAAKGGQAYAFDYGNRLRWASGREQYAYDGMGRRVLATALAEGSQSILSLYSHGGQLLFQQDNRDAVSHAYLYLGSRLVATVDYPFSGGSVVRYAHSDAQGSVLVETDTTRAIAKVSVYDSWGALLNHANDDAPGYTGHLQDSQTGLTYMQQRYYDPSVGRFLSMDPVGVNTTGGGNFNRYWYANDNPYRHTDPDGRRIWTDQHGELPGLGCLAYGVGCSHSLDTGSQPKAKQSSRPAGQCDETCDPYRQMYKEAMHEKFQGVKQAGIFGAKKLGKFAFWAVVGHGFGRFVEELRGLGRFLGFATKDISIGTKIEGQMVRRGWTKSMIEDAVNDPARTVVTRDWRFMSGGDRMSDPATACYSKQGGYVVRSNRTGDIVQISDRTKQHWRAPWDN